MRFKTCSRCNRKFGTNKFHAHPSGAHGVAGRCKTCVSAVNQFKYAREHGLKVCTTCLRSLSRSKFYNTTQSTDGVSSRCKSCYAEYGQQYTQLNPKAESNRKANSCNILSNDYIKKILTQNGSKLRSEDIPIGMIEVKRAHLKLKRELERTGAPI